MSSPVGLGVAVGVSVEDVAAVALGVAVGALCP